MSTVAEIKAAIDKLTPEERCELEALMHPFKDVDWDRQMRRDAAAGTFDALNCEAATAEGAGQAIPLSDILRDS
jgi:hypothetical protein